MAMNNQSILLIDPEIAQKQFEKELETKKKLEVLKGPVFKNFTIKKSKSVIHPITRYSQQLQIQPINQNKLNFENKLQKDQLGVTNIKFQLATLRRSKSIKVSSTARNLPSFSPRKTCPPKKTSFFIEQKIKETVMNPESKIRKSVSTKVKALELRDSQTILRKNSLFLVNCLRTRYKQSHKKAHIGQTHAVENMRLGFFTQKQASLTHYQQRFEYMEEARQRLLNAQQPDPDSRNGVRSPLLPEPW